MDTIKPKLKYTAAALLILTIVWVVLTAILMSGVKSTWSPNDFLLWTAKAPTLLKLSYINVVVLTLVNVVFFSLLYLYFRKRYPVWSLLGYCLVPLYAVVNFVCYSIQISAVPRLASRVLKGQNEYAFVKELIQANPNSIIGMLNGYAYGILGIPLLIMGHLLSKELKHKSGYLLMGSGITSLVGAAGMIMKSILLTKGIMLGGVLFLIALAFFLYEFKSDQSSVQ